MDICVSDRQLSAAGGPVFMRDRERAVRKIRHGSRTPAGQKILIRAFKYLSAAQDARVGSDVYDIVGRTDEALVVLDADNGISIFDQFPDDLQQILLFILMQSDRRLIKHKDDGIHLGDDIRCEKQALDLSARQARNRSVKRQVRQSHVAKALQFLFKLFLKRRFFDRQPLKESQQIIQIHTAQFRDGPAADLRVGGLAAEPRAFAASAFFPVTAIDLPGP